MCKSSALTPVLSLHPTFGDLTRSAGVLAWLVEHAAGALTAAV